MADVMHVRATDTDAIAGALERNGAVIVDGLFSADLLARFNAEVDPLLAGSPAGHERRFINDAIGFFFGDRTDHVTGIAGKSRVFATEILTHRVYMAVCDRILRPHCARYQLNVAQVLDRGPGAAQQILHRDEDVWIHLPRPHPEVQLASVVALVDFTADNGATRVVPGSHRWDRDRLPADEELVAAEMPAGSAVIYLGSTIHAGGANVTSDARRRGMHVSYCLGWLRTEENQVLATPLETARRLPRLAQELLGFGAHDAIESGGGYLGAVELQDPVELMASGEL